MEMRDKQILLTTEEAAAYCHIGVSTLFRYKGEGKFPQPSHKVPKNLYPLEALNSWLETKRVRKNVKSVVK